MDIDYVMDVVAGSRACIAGYSAVQAYIAAVWALLAYEELERERKTGHGKGEKGGGENRGKGSVRKPRKVRRVCRW